MSVSNRQLQALTFLGFYFALHWVRRVLRIVIGRPGIKRFRSYYANDGLGTFNAEERQVLAGLSGCIACSLCEEQLPDDSPAPATVYRSPSILGHLVLKTPEEAGNITPWLTMAEALPWNQVSCPYGVPLEQGLKLMQSHLQEAPAAPESVKASKKKSKRAKQDKPADREQESPAAETGLVTVSTDQPPAPVEDEPTPTLAAEEAIEDLFDSPDGGEDLDGLSDVISIEDKPDKDE